MEGGDEAVQNTNDDATICKRSAIQLGYWSDPYLNYFIHGPIVRKPPEINRGYFARSYGIYHLVQDVASKIQPSSRIQIINLGSGSDTLYFRLKTDGIFHKKKIIISNYVDFDFPSTTMKKIHSIKSAPQLLSQLNNDDGEISMSNFDLHSYNYHIIGADLRDINQVSNGLKCCGFVSDEVTIVIAECCLVYMDPKSSTSLLSLISSTFKNSIFINYEQVNMRDKFAEVMLSNLVQRGCLLSGVDYCKDIETQKQRFSESGWSSVRGWTMNEVYSKIPSKELKRIESIELLDEKELLTQLFDHYAIIIATNSINNDHQLQLVGF